MKVGSSFDDVGVDGVANWILTSCLAHKSCSRGTLRLAIIVRGSCLRLCGSIAQAVCSLLAKIKAAKESNLANFGKRCSKLSNTNPYTPTTHLISTIIARKAAISGHDPHCSTHRRDEAHPPVRTPNAQRLQNLRPVQLTQSPPQRCRCIPRLLRECSDSSTSLRRYATASTSIF